MLGLWVNHSPNHPQCASIQHSSQYHYAGSGWSGSTLYYFFGEDTNYAKNTNYIPFAPVDQQKNKQYSYYGIFYTYWWFSLDNSNNLDVYFLVNGNIYNNQLPEQYDSKYKAYAILPESPYTYIAQSYQNAYKTAFAAELRTALNEFSKSPITYPSSNFPYSLFINGTLGYAEQYENQYSIGNPLIENVTYYQGQPYVFISAGSGGSPGYMYLDWVIGTFGVPYEITIP
ncbi:hypothetical protein [Vulcanisaeta moutnovskia]|nr:hypothetical protein [Vulcanisaeta moutnovskia]